MMTAYQYQYLGPLQLHGGSMTAGELLALALGEGIDEELLVQAQYDLAGLAFSGLVSLEKGGKRIYGDWRDQRLSLTARGENALGKARDLESQERRAG